MANGGDGWFRTNNFKYALPTGLFIRSPCANVGAKYFSKYSASSVPILNIVILPTFPNIESFILSGSWPINWFAIIKLSLYLRASDKMVSISGVV